jgi:hypothetical protein
LTRPTLPTALAVSAAAALLLSACGGSSGSDTIDDTTRTPSAGTAGSGNSATPSASPSPSRASVARPDISLPKDLIVAFDGWKTGDPKRDAALSDSAQSTLASDQGVVLGTANTPAVRFYFSGDALVTTAQFVALAVKNGITFTGTMRYFNPRITFFGDSSAGLAYCGDETKAFAKDRKTGTKSGGGSATDPRSYVSYSTRLAKDGRGVWQTTSISSTRGGKPCVP